MTESDLENYIFDQIPVLPQLTKLREDFYVTYTVYANRKFFFFLDSQRNRQIRILVSSVRMRAHDLERICSRTYRGVGVYTMCVCLGEEEGDDLAWFGLARV